MALRTKTQSTPNLPPAIFLCFMRTSAKFTDGTPAWEVEIEVKNSIQDFKKNPSEENKKEATQMINQWNEWLNSYIAEQAAKYDEDAKTHNKRKIGYSRTATSSKRSRTATSSKRSRTATSSKRSSTLSTSESNLTIRRSKRHRPGELMTPKLYNVSGMGFDESGRATQLSPSKVCKTCERGATLNEDGDIEICEEDSE